MKRLGKILSEILLLAFSFSALAQQSLPEIQVEVIEKKLENEEEAKNPTRFITVLKTEPAQEENKTVEEVLSESSGVQINRWGGLGAFSTVSIRGANPNQVELYLDGIPLNLAWSGIFNLGDLNLDYLEKIEVYRGFAPVEFSRNGIGGVVNLVTRTYPGEKTGEINASAGSFDTYKLNFFFAQGLKNWSWLAFYSHLQSLGNYEYESDNGTPLNPDDDYTTKRKNNDFDLEDLILKTKGKARSVEIDFLGNFHYKDQGVAGLDIAPTEHTRLSTKRALANFQIQPTQLLNRALELKIRTSYFWQEERYQDPYGETGVGNQDQLNLSESYSLALDLSWYPLAIEFFRVGFEARREWFLAKDLLGDFTGAPQVREMLNLGVEAGVASEDKNLLLSPSLRYHHSRSDFKGEPYFTWSSFSESTQKSYDFFDPALGVRFFLFPELAFKGNIGAYHRLPTFYELFGDRGVVVGNSDLKPEQGLNYDFGFQYQRKFDQQKQGYVQLGYFHSEIKDMIIFFQNSQRTVVPINIGKALIQGVELNAGIELTSHWQVSGNYTYQKATDESNISYWQGKQLPFRPVHELHFRLAWEEKERARFWSEANYISENYWDRANLYQVPSRTIINLGAIFYFKVKKSQLKLGAEVKNLLDDQISDVAGYPLPGRSYFINIGWKF